MVRKRGGQTYQLPMGGKWHVYTDAQLMHARNNGLEAEADFFLEKHAEYKLNPLRFFLAHSGGLDFINDQDHDVLLLRAPNQSGKTFLGLFFLGLAMVPTDSDWEVYTENGIIYVPWGGPIEAGAASYQWKHSRRNLWPKLRMIMPVDELKEYSPLWNPKNKRNRAIRQPNWQADPSVPFACGSRLDFYAYHQPAEAFAGPTYARFLLDEQAPEHIFDEIYARGTTIDDFRIAITFTPHKVKGRPDTGAGTWLHRMINGIYSKDLNWDEFRISMDEVPSAIVSEEKKKHLFRKYIQIPTETGDYKSLRNGKSRWYGDFESGEGMVYDNYVKGIHWIDPFPIPHWWNRFRAIDPGYSKPAACLWGAMSPWGDLVLYREFYQAGLATSNICEAIIKASGNNRELKPGRGVKIDKIGGGSYRIPAFMEVKTAEKFVWTVMDGRTFSSPGDEGGMTYGDLYQLNGLPCGQASGKQNKNALPIVRELFECKPGHKHVLESMGIVKPGEILGPDGKPITKAPSIYIFNTLSNWELEMEGYINKPEKEDDPVDDNDHLMTAMKYMVLEGPRITVVPDYLRKDEPRSLASKIQQSRRKNMARR